MASGTVRQHDLSPSGSKSETHHLQRIPLSCTRAYHHLARRVEVDSADGGGQVSQRFDRLGLESRDSIGVVRLGTGGGE